jgi:glycosyltransferase involved in cell wall biosynthesis
MLKDALLSVLAQDFPDFEVIVGNDYTSEVLTCEMLGICDPRIQIVNHPENLREVGNMNALLEIASGRYFTWLFDDDLYEPGFLQATHDCLTKTGFPPALFPSFRMMKVQEKFQPQSFTNAQKLEFSGRELLRWYSADSPQIASTCGMFDTEILKVTIGGFESLSPSTIALYSEFLLLVRCALLDRIIFIDAPYYIFRRHAESYSESNLDKKNHLIAGHELIKKSAEVLLHPTLAEDFSKNLQKICMIHIITFAYKTARVEFAQDGFTIGTLICALSKHWCEFRKTREKFLGHEGTAGLKSTLLFFRTLLHCQYLIVRLLIHFHTMSRKL